MELQEPAFWKSIQQVVPSFIRRRKVPQLLQMGSVECGAACLAMILSYYGRKTSVSAIREHCGVGRDGLSAQHIVKGAQDYGLRTRALALRENNFRHIKLPAIVHWEFDHFLVVERWTPGWVDVVDPAIGRRRLTAEEFDTGFTGVVLLFEPGVYFQRRRVEPGINLSTYLTNCFRQAPWAFIQILLASLLLQVFGLGVPLLTDIVVDLVIARHIPSIMVLLGLGIIVILLSQVVTMILRAFLMIYLQARVDTYMMLSFIEHLLALPLRFFHRRSTGDILARLSSNTAIRETLSNQLVSAILDGSFVTVYLVILFLQSPIFGCIVLGIGLSQAMLLLCTARPIRDLALRELIAQGRAQGYGNEVLTGIVSLKAAGAEHRAFERWSNLFFDQINSSIRHNTLTSVLQTIISLLQMVSPLVLLWVGTLLVLERTMPLGTMLFLNALAVAFLTPLSSLMGSGQRLQVVRSHLERLTDVMEAQPEQLPQDVSRPARLTGRIALEHVSFRYDQHSPEVLKDIHVTIEAGQRVAIVGRTGSGKSTLGKLLLGLYLPSAGEILYDGVPLHTLNYQAVRSQFGVVMQEITVFGSTIRQNIAFNDPTINLEQVIDAAQKAMLHEEVQAMPMNYETYVSEQGNALSGGQRQRLALARALAHSPAVLLLDEATSALDVVTERRIEQNLRTLGCTQIIIAHRLSTIRDANLILVLHEGTIVEQGTHDELLTLNGQYAELLQNQFLRQDSDYRGSDQH